LTIEEGSPSAVPPKAPDALLVKAVGSLNSKELSRRLGVLWRAMTYQVGKLVMSRDKNACYFSHPCRVTVNSQIHEMP
jgi:hypothetical protein